MEKLQIKSKLISLEKQLEVIERAKSKPTTRGLCIDIDRAIESLVGNRLPKKSILIQLHVAMYIPLFEFKNAKSFVGAMDIWCFWWEHQPYDFESRANFLDWMIEKTREEMNKNIK